MSSLGFADLNKSPFIPSSKALQDDRRISYHKDYLENLLFAIKYVLSLVVCVCVCVCARVSVYCLYCNTKGFFHVGAEMAQM